MPGGRGMRHGDRYSVIHWRGECPRCLVTHDPRETDKRREISARAGLRERDYQTSVAILAQMNHEYPIAMPHSSAARALRPGVNLENRATSAIGDGQRSPPRSFHLSEQIVAGAADVQVLCLFKAKMGLVCFHDFVASDFRWSLLAPVSLIKISVKTDEYRFALFRGDILIGVVEIKLYLSIPNQAGVSLGLIDTTLCSIDKDI